MDIDLSTIWPEWKVTNVIGKGSFGTVYRIVRDGKYEAALKVIDVPSQDEINSKYAEGMDTRSIIEEYQGQVDAIGNEIELMESLKSAMHVVTIEDYRITAKTNGEIVWRIYIRMELLQSMASYLKTRDPLSEREVVKLGIDICDALKACQSLNIIHRDIKPGNIFRTGFGDYKLGDFGISRQVEATYASTRIGTPSYEAPEILHGEKYDRTVDIYALGVVLYTYLNRGRKPFYPLPPAVPTVRDREIADLKKSNREEFPDPADASTELSFIIKKACSPYPKDRYQDAGAFYDDLVQYLLKQRGTVKPGSQEAEQENENDTVLVNRVPPGGSRSYSPPKKRNRKKKRKKKKLPVMIMGIGIIIAAFLCAIAFLKRDPAPARPFKGTLMADGGSELYGEDIGSSPAFGSLHMRKEISSIYILDSLDGAPDDAIDVSEEKDGSVIAWFESDADASGLYEMYIAGNNGMIAPQDSDSLFAGYTLLEKIEFYDAFDTGNVTDMGSMFKGCKSLTSLDMSSFDTGNVTDMTQMFSGCDALASVNVSSFDTGNVTDMRQMFSWCKALASLDVSSFNTGNVTNMSNMFSGCESLTLLDLGSFSTGNVTDMSSMFYSCTSLMSLNVSSFDTGKVTDMSGMFFECESLASLNVSFDTGKVTNMSLMFGRCRSLTSLDVSSFDTRKVTDMSLMFRECRSLTLLDLSVFDTSNVTNMSDMFLECSAEIIGRGKFANA